MKEKNVKKELEKPFEYEEKLKPKSGKLGL